MDRKLESCSKPSAVRMNPFIISTMEKLYADRKKTGDIKFIIDGKVIQAHRCVLAALSPRYEAQFYGAMAETNTINVTDVSPAAFEEFLQFFYTDEVTLTLDNIEDVLNLAKQSLVDELIAECKNFLIDLVGLDRIVLCYQLALVYDMKPLEAFCMKHIGVNIKKIFKTEDFLNCDRDTLCHILDIDSFNCNETDVFDACIAWARARCKEQGLGMTSTVNLRAALGEAFFKIRFRSMEFEEFADIDRKWSGLLSAQESNEIFQEIASMVHGTAIKWATHRNREQFKRSLECSFSKGPRTEITLPIRSVNKGITFRCDETIELSGLVLCNRIADDNILVSIATSGVTQIPKIKTSHSNSNTVIKFANSITITVNELCSIYTDSKEFQKSGLFGYKIQSDVVEHGVAFQFASTNHKKLKLITHLLFEIVD